jgi:hypothetical protein
VKIADAMAQAEEAKASERELWAALVAALSAFGDAWLALNDHYSSWIKLRGSHRSLGAYIPPEARGKWDMVWAPVVRIPVNGRSAFSMLWDMCVRFPRGQFASPPVPELRELAPDLSHLLTTMEIPGDVEKHTGGSE